MRSPPRLAPARPGLSPKEPIARAEHRGACPRAVSYGPPSVRPALAFLYFFLALVLGFLAGAFLLFGGSGGLVPAAIAGLLAAAAGVLAWRASSP